MNFLVKKFIKPKNTFLTKKITKREIDEYKTIFSWFEDKRKSLIKLILIFCAMNWGSVIIPINAMIEPNDIVSNKVDSKSPKNKKINWYQSLLVKRNL